MPTDDYHWIRGNEFRREKGLPPLSKVEFLRQEYAPYIEAGVPMPGGVAAGGYRSARPARPAVQDDPRPIEFITSNDLAESDFGVDWLIPGVLTRGEPGMIIGPMKACKTTVSIDLALSLATATPFLSCFPCETECRVGLVSAESGKATIQETARRIAGSKGADLAEVPNAIWSFQIPSLADPDNAVATLTDAVNDNGLAVLILDPLYLALGGTGEEGNIYVMGQRFKPLAEVAQDTGVTLILCHHSKKSRANPHVPLELHDAAFSGAGEWMRQWILLSRRSRYEPSQPGSHRLWISVGGVGWSLGRIRGRHRRGRPDR